MRRAFLVVLALMAAGGTILQTPFQEAHHLIAALMGLAIAWRVAIRAAINERSRVITQRRSSSSLSLRLAWIWCVFPLLCVGITELTCITVQRITIGWIDRDRPGLEANLDQLEQQGDWPGIVEQIENRLRQPLSEEWRKSLSRREYVAALAMAAKSDMRDGSLAFDRAKRIAMLEHWQPDLHDELLDLLTSAQHRLEFEQALRISTQKNVDTLHRWATSEAEHYTIALPLLDEAIQLAEKHGLEALDIKDARSRLRLPRNLPSSSAVQILRDTASGPARIVDLLAIDNNGRHLNDLHRSDFMLESLGKVLTRWSIAQVHPEVEPGSIVICVDHSGSTEGVAWAAVKNSLPALLNQFKSQHRKVVGFAETVHLLCDWYESDATCEQRLSATKPAGSTALLQTVDYAVREVSTKPSPRSIIVFTDGRDTVGGVAIDEVLLAASQAGVTIHVIALESKELDSVVLRRIARVGEGEYLTAARATDLQARFDRVAEGLRRPFYRLVIVDSAIDTRPFTIRLGVNPGCHVQLPLLNANATQGFRP